MLGDDFLERAPRAGGITHLDLAARNVEQRVGDLLAVGICRQQLPLGRDRRAKIP